MGNNLALIIVASTWNRDYSILTLFLSPVILCTGSGGSCSRDLSMLIFVRSSACTDPSSKNIWKEVSAVHSVHNRTKETHMENLRGRSFLLSIRLMQDSSENLVHVHPNLSWGPKALCPAAVQDDQRDLEVTLAPSIFVCSWQGEISLHPSVASRFAIPFCQFLI